MECSSSPVFICFGYSYCLGYICMAKHLVRFVACSCSLCILRSSRDLVADRCSHPKKIHIHTHRRTYTYSSPYTKSLSLSSSQLSRRKKKKTNSALVLSSMRPAPHLNCNQTLTHQHFKYRHTQTQTHAHTQSLICMHTHAYPQRSSSTSFHLCWICYPVLSFDASLSLCIWLLVSSFVLLHSSFANNALHYSCCSVLCCRFSFNLTVAVASTHKIPFRFVSANRNILCARVYNIQKPKTQRKRSKNKQKNTNIYKREKHPVHHRFGSSTDISRFCSDFDCLCFPFHTNNRIGIKRI